MNKKQVSPLEVQITNTICEYLEKKNHCFWRSNNVPMFSSNSDGSIRMRSMPKYTPKGLPDITLIKNGIYHGIEVKRLNCYQSPEQIEIEMWIKQHGGKYFIARGIDDIIENEL